MTEQIKRPGRPKSDSKLTPAEKQANYRLRCAARDKEQQDALDFKKSFEYQINYEIAQALKNYQSSHGDRDTEANYHRLNELKRFKLIMEAKQKTGWKQTELF